MDQEAHAPRPSLLTLDEDGVAHLFASLGFPFYEAQIKEHGITGDILVHLDHEALKDVGIHSVGQRLAILRGVYALKVQQSVPVEEGHYVPPSEDMEQIMVDSPSGVMPPEQIIGMLYERDDRIRNLETEVQRLHDTLVTMRDEVQSRSNSKLRPAVRSPTSNLFPHPLSNSSTHASANLSAKIRPSDTSNGLPDSPRSPMDSPRLHSDLDPDASGRGAYHQHSSASDYVAPPFTSGALTPTTPTGAAHDMSSSLPTSHSSHFLSSSAGPASNVPLPAIPPPSRPSTSERERSERHGASSSSDNPYRSFRVTLEDPCYKVLPAALKKYKINDDWRQYALFICYGNTERCLSYDEKPLLLFQRLKEQNANPVFMLRHIKDIKSPIAVATGKHALRRDKRPANAGIGVDKPPTTTKDGQLISRANRLHHPPVLLPLAKDKDKDKDEVEDDPGARPLASPREAPGYCISIYPYLAEREDEFDVAVGDTFVILQKTKGWWVVHRDLGPNSASDTGTRKSAWVPAGCLLETNVPPLSLADFTTLSSTAPHNAANVPIEPAYVVSVSTPGVALMDYVRNGSDELDVKKGTQLRILKRYNHWSYAIKEDGQRGWIPSWFCGRASRGDGTPTTPTASAGRDRGIAHPLRIPTAGEGDALSPAEGRGSAAGYELP